MTPPLHDSAPKKEGHPRSIVKQGILRLVFFFLRGVGSLPYPWLYKLGGLLGLLLYVTLWRQRRIAHINLSLCFPEYNDQQCRVLLHRNFVAMGIGLMETAMLWFGRARAWDHLIEWCGREHYEDARQRGKGAIILSFHLTSLEIGGCLLGRCIPLAALYRNNENPTIEHAMRSGRAPFVHLIPHEATLRFVRWLKSNGCVWYAADQDYGRDQSVFVPFMGVTAATITATSRYVQLTGATVIPLTQRRIDGGKKIELTLHPPLPIRGDDPVKEAQLMNQFLSDYLHQHPEDYLWVYKRFKTRSQESAPSYYPQRKNWRRVTPKVYQYLRDTAEWIEEQDGKPLRIKHPQGVIYFIYRGHGLRSVLAPPYRQFIKQQPTETHGNECFHFQGLVRHCRFLNCDLVYLQNT